MLMASFTKPFIHAFIVLNIHSRKNEKKKKKKKKKTRLYPATPNTSPFMHLHEV